MRLTDNELLELKETFKDVINYESDDPCEPIDPLTYVAPDEDNCLHIAAWRGNVRAIQLLIKAGVNVNKTGDMGETPLHIAIRNGNDQIVKALLIAGAKTDIISEFGDSAKKLAEASDINLDIE